jgi:type II secretory pathway predicted ATPase ExeA
MYNEFYGFSEKPFELTPNPRFLYLTRSHREALVSIVDGIRDRRGFVSMMGGVGTGKTILIHSLLNRLDEKVRTVLIFHTTITFADLLGTILHELGLAPVNENRMDLLHQLVQHLAQMGRRGETLLVIIDEAQNLPAKVLEDLQMFCELESKGIQIVLVGQPELGDKLRSENLKRLRRSIKTRCQISGLSGAESREYIDHRLRLAGSSSSRIFSPKALSLICAYAQGVPRVINTLCDNALLMGSSSLNKKIDVDIVREVIKNMEGPPPQRMMSSSTAIVRKCQAFLSGLRYLLKKAPLIIIVSLLCLGAFIFLARRHTEQKSAGIWDIRSLERPYVDTESLPTPTPSRVTPPSSSMPAVGRRYRLKEMIAVKKGQTISQLTQKYYGVVNLTLIDFLSEVNPEITNVHLIIVDQKIKIPYITEELLMIRSADRSYKIHAGTFENPDSARNYSDDPSLKGKKIEVFPRKVSPRETWYRVMIGKFENKDEALKTISLLRKKGMLPAFEKSSKS